jgi:CBS domain-containing protein
MADQEVDCLAVASGRELVGIFTERDLVEAIADRVDLDTTPVTEYMAEAPDVVAPSVSVTEAATWLMQTGYRHLPVMEEGELLGIVGVRDLLWALLPELDEVSEDG